MTTVERIKLDMGAKEPWPKDVALYQPHEVEQIILPDNANCLAVQAFLKMCNLDYALKAKPNAEAMSPSGKVPFIKCGQFLVSELDGIVQFLNSKDISISKDLSDSEKGDVRVYMSLIHTVLEPAENYVCYMDSETYSKITKPRAGSVYPFPLNHIKCYEKRQEEIKKLKLLKWHEKSLDDVYSEVEKCCDSLSQRLGDNKYFCGSKKSEADCLVYAHLYTIFTNPLPLDDNEFMLKIGKFDKLVEFVKNFDKEVMGRETKFPMKKYSEWDDDQDQGDQGGEGPPQQKDNCNTCPDDSESPPPQETPPPPPSQEEEPPPPEEEPPPPEEEPPPPPPPKQESSPRTNEGNEEDDEVSRAAADYE